ncbi:MAG: serine hydrolase [Balneolaceae bacterium]
MPKLKYLPIVVLLATITACTSPSPNNIDNLKKQINDRLSELEGDFAVAFQSLDDPDASILINVDDRFHAASTMKTPLLIEIFKQAEAGLFSLEDSITIINEFASIVDGSPYSMVVSEDSEEDLYGIIGKKASISDLTYQMITQSSNLATNILIEFVRPENVNKTMREIGADSIDVLRGVEDLKAYEAGLSNTTTAKDLLIIFNKIGSYSLLSKDSHERILSILKDQVHNDMFPVKLPEGTEIAHKTGWITNVHHDSGIIYLPDGQAFVLVFLSKNAPDTEAVRDAAADIAKWSYDFLEQEGK